MKRFAALAFVLLLASFLPTAPAAAETQASAAAAPHSSNAEALTNDTIIEMVTAKLPEDVIITRIQVSPNNFDLSTPALAELNQKGVSAAILKAMLTAPKAVAPAAPASNTGQQGSAAPAVVQASSRTGNIESITPLVTSTRSSPYAKMAIVDDDGQTLTVYVFGSTAVTDMSANDLNQGGKFQGARRLKKGQRVEVKYSLITNGSTITNGQFRADSIHSFE